MVDIFISYARDDQATVRRLAAVLEAQGWSVFWDLTIPAGESWRSYIGKALADARCVVVAWSEASIKSHYVLEEAEAARKRNVLVPVLLAVIDPPFGFGSITAAKLVGWDGGADDELFVPFRAAIARKLGDPPALTGERQAAGANGEVRKSSTQKPGTAKPNPLPKRIAIALIVVVSILAVIAWNRMPTATTKIPPATYALSVTTTPPGASIEIENVGQYAPGMRLKAGSYKVRATLGGYQAVERTFEVAKRDVVLEIALQPTLPLPKLVRIPAGTFMMGSVDGGSNERPVRAVHIDQPFYLGATEVTFAQYDAFAEATGRAVPNYQDWGDDHPVIDVSWDDTQAYARWLSAMTGNSCRLPSEAEWEYAARAGTETRYGLPAPEGGDDLNGSANCADCGSSEHVTAELNELIGKQTLPVGSFPANAWGVHDMHGNVWEWVEDCWHDSYEGAPMDGSAWLAENGGECSLRVLRGGSWFYVQAYARSAFRFRLNPFSRFNFIGFRVLCSSPILSTDH